MWPFLRCLRIGVRNNLCLILAFVMGLTLHFLLLTIFENMCIFSEQIGVVRKSEAASLIFSDEYEPRINLAGKPLKAKKTPQDFIRPRYYSTELGIRQKLFVAVLTSPGSFDVYGTAFNKTLHHLVDKIVFFSEKEPGQNKAAPFLTGFVKFSDSRLILKPFHMLKYISDNFLDEFDYFYLVRDTTYVHGRKLMKLAESLSISQDVHLGAGKMDQLTSFCSLDGGILLSSLLMRRVAANLDWCVKNAFSDVDDANLGRCIVHATDVPCLNEVQGVRYHGLHLVNAEMPIERILKDSNLLESVSVWPMSKPDVFYRLHFFLTKKDMEGAMFEIKSLRHAIQNTTVVLPGNRTEAMHWPIGTPGPNKPANRFDLLRWDYFTDQNIYLQNDFKNVDPLLGAHLSDVQNVLNATVKYLEKKYEGELVYKRIINGYRRFDPSRGMDYILDLAVRDTVTGHESHRRFEVCKPLGKVELIPVPYVTENTRVNIIQIATAENNQQLLHFIDLYATVCMEKREKTSLLLVLVYEANHPGKGLKNDIHAALKAAAVKQSERFRRDNNKITWVSVKLPASSASAVLPVGILNILLMDLALKKFSLDNLFLVGSSNMELRQDYLNRVRMNTVKEYQIFSPIPFSEFNPLVVYDQDLPRPKDLDINKNYGHYDTTNSHHISFYLLDYKEARKTIENHLPIAHSDKDLGAQWNKDQLSSLSNTGLYGLFVRNAKLHILRGVEPGQRLRYVDRDCGRPPLDACLEQNAFNLGPRNKLGRLVLDYHRAFRKA